jgi:hypothetical protein
MIDLDEREARERFDETCEAARRGERFRIFRDGRPVAILEQIPVQDPGIAISPTV